MFIPRKKDMGLGSHNELASFRLGIALRRKWDREGVNFVYAMDAINIL